MNAKELYRLRCIAITKAYNAMPKNKEKRIAKRKQNAVRSAGEWKEVKAVLAEVNLRCPEKSMPS